MTRSLAWATYSSRRTSVPSLLGPCHCTAHVLWCVLVHGCAVGCGVLWRGDEVGALSRRVVSVSGNQLLRMTKHGCREFSDFNHDSDREESTRTTWDTLEHEGVPRIVSYKAL